MTRIELLGPQRFRPMVTTALGALPSGGPIAVVTAGWQEREHEVEELDAHIGRSTVNLRLYRRCEELFQKDRELAAAHRQRQDRMRQLQDLYRVRLAPCEGAARDLLTREGEPSLLEPERRAAVETLRSVDAHHVRRTAEIHEEFEESYRPGERPAVARHRRELAGILEESSVLLVAGGHVAVLLNRLRLFDVGGLAAGKPVVAWSAGAMALAERVVLFHDSPPQGAGAAEVLDAGLGLFPDLVPLPHARRRLDLGDPVRVALLARRFSPATCVAMDEGARLGWDGREWRPGPAVLRLDVLGGLSALGHA